jgi:hypothetical protein
MYTLKPDIKKDPKRRWALPDRIFFGHGACHILAGVYLRDPPLEGFYAERIIPSGDMAGNHIFVTNGAIAFDYHGYSGRERLLTHHRKVWSSRYSSWNCEVEAVNFELLNTDSLNAHKMLGPDQYLHSPVERAWHYLSRINHRQAFSRCADLLTNSTEGYRSSVSLA